MEAKELMIGDWIKMSPIQDETNNKDVTIRKVDCYVIYDLSLVDERVKKAEWEITPIPLTEEILKLNKIWCFLPKETDDFDMDWLIPRGGVHIIQDGVEFWLFNDFLSIRYVHELQHALRLCELFDLADNFKVE